MEVVKNTLYVMTNHAYLHREREQIVLKLNEETIGRVPLHHVESICLMGLISISPYLLHECAERGVSVCFHNEFGKFLARVDAPQNGNILLRKRQFILSDDNAFCAEISRLFTAGKIRNQRAFLLRAKRESKSEEKAKELGKAAASLVALLKRLERAKEVDEIRGIEGSAARSYFGAFPAMMHGDDELYRFAGRIKRPPKDAVNALLSYGYTLLHHACVSACYSAGLDPYAGFLHKDRPGRSGLALDLMEEFRTPMVDRMVIALINRSQLENGDFAFQEGGAVEMGERNRKIVIREFQNRGAELIKHDVTEEKKPWKLFPFVQARLLALMVRGDTETYTPYRLT